MLLVGMLTLAAHAGEGCGFVVSGFAVETRTDAPTDAELLIDATFAPIVTVVDGPNGAEPLDSEVLTSCETTGLGLAKVSPPASGWEPNATYTVESQPGHDDEGGPIPFTFTTSDVASAAPADPTIVSVSATDWSEDTKYPWGCCKPTRQVTITVDAASSDPWAYVELKGDFEGPSQITTEPLFQRLSVGIGPGTHVLTAIQWKDDKDTLEPWAFEVAQVEANGATSTAQRVEIDLDGDTGSSVDCCKKMDGSPDMGCAVVPNAASIYAVLAALAMARRRPR
jgi:hypothetical protein